jgi:SAM-dependent methyltransferase
MRPVLRQLINTIVIRPIKGTWSAANDFWLNIDTRDGNISSERDNAKPWPLGYADPKADHTDNHINKAAEYWSIRRLLGQLGSVEGDVVYELGCGKGRVVCEFARKPTKRVVGVELNEHHAQTARSNSATLRGRRSPIEILCADAAKTNLSDCTLLFMCNPFGPDTLRAVMSNLEQSLRSSPRRVRVVYYTPEYCDVIDACPWLKRSWKIGTLRGDSIILWESV